MIKDAQATNSQLEKTLAETRKRLEKEKIDLHDARLITSNLENRIERLRAEIAEQTQKTPEQIAQEALDEEQQRNQRYQKETKRLVRAFNSFVDTQLAAMLAAEELGGPVVGELLDISDEILGAGFNTQGKILKNKLGKHNVEDGKRQRRIDEIWGYLRAGDGVEGGQGGLDEGPLSEQEAAGAEMRQLTEELLNTAAKDSGAYVDLPRDSAAARFLVRAKVAQFHPRDANRLRLIDFGRELED